MSNGIYGRAKLSPPFLTGNYSFISCVIPRHTWDSQALSHPGTCQSQTGLALAKWLYHIFKLDLVILNMIVGQLSGSFGPCHLGHRIPKRFYLSLSSSCQKHRSLFQKRKWQHFGLCFLNISQDSKPPFEDSKSMVI